MASGIGMRKYGTGGYVSALAGWHHPMALGAVSVLLALVGLRCGGWVYAW